MSLLDDLDQEQKQQLDGLGLYQSNQGEGAIIKQKGLDTPARNTHMVGHNLIEKNIVNLVHKNELPHALIFHGISGIGKATMAYRLAKYLFSLSDKEQNQNSLFGDGEIKETTDLSSDLHNSAVQLVMAGSHPDLMIVEPSETGKGEIKIEGVRPVLNLLQKTASRGGWRIVLIDQAQKMNVAAQNSLLRTLEEPPEKTLLILITNSPARLLPTIRSRCRQILFSPLSEQDLKKLLEIDEKETGLLNQTQIISLAKGSYSHLCLFLDEERQKIITKFLTIFDPFPMINKERLHQFSDNISQDQSHKQLTDFLDIMNWFLERMIRECVYAQTNQILFDEEEEILDYLHKKEEQKIIDDLMRIREHFIQNRLAIVQLNLDKKTAVMNLMLLFESIA